MACLTKIEAIIPPSAFARTKQALAELGLEAMTVLEVYGPAPRGGRHLVFRGHQYRADLVPNIKIELVVNSDCVDEAVDAIVDGCAFEKSGVAKVFLSPVEDALRIRNQQVGVAAL